ncbi:MAG: hypothetical protein ACFB16_22390 [Phormidesmis sp.]
MRTFKNDIKKKDVKQELRRLLQAALLVAQETAPSEREKSVRESLDNIQTYCKQVDKVFIVCEQSITCAQYKLGGSSLHAATLFRGPSEDASVAICVTDKGSVLHRNDSDWNIYCHAGDVNPLQDELLVSAA